MDGLALISDFHPTHFDIICLKVLFSLRERLECVEVDLVISSLVSKTVELLHCFHLFTPLRSIRNIEDLAEPKCARRSNNGSDVVLFADIMQEQICLRLLFIH